jgi:hypothetical protein
VEGDIEKVWYISMGHMGCLIRHNPSPNRLLDMPDGESILMDMVAVEMSLLSEIKENVCETPSVNWITEGST